MAEQWIKLDGEVAGTSHWIFANLRNITNRSTAYAIGGFTASGFEARFLTFTNCNHGIRISSSDYTKVYNCTFQGIRGDAAITLFNNVATSVGNSLVYSNSIGLTYSTNQPEGWAGSAYSGPDGIQADDGTSVYNNIFRIGVNTNIITSNQHPDYLQITGCNLRIYNNEFINIGDSAIDLNASVNPAGMTNVWIYNNLFRIETVIDPFPEYIRLYGHESDPMGAEISNLVIANNTFADLDTWTMMRIHRYWNADIEMSNNRIQNNLFIRCGDGTGRQTWLLELSTNYTTGDWTISHNVYWHPTPTDAVISYLGTEYVAPVWLDQEIETDSSTNQPTFASYTAFSAANDFRLAAEDTVARGQGVNLSAYFTTDKNGVPRGSTWDIGAFEFQPSRIWNIGTLNAVNANIGGD